MIDFPNCPNCGNISNCFRVEKFTFNNKTTNAIVCSCGTIIDTFLAYEDVEEMINDRVRDLEDKIEELESTLQRIKNKTEHKPTEEEVNNIIDNGLDDEAFKNEAR